MSRLGHQRRFKRKSPTSAYAPMGHIAAARRSANHLLTRDEAQIAAKHRQAAGAAAQGLKRARVRSASRCCSSLRRSDPAQCTVALPAR